MKVLAKVASAGEQSETGEEKIGKNFLKIFFIIMPFNQGTTCKTRDEKMTIRF